MLKSTRGRFCIRRIALILAIVWTLAVVVALAALGERMRPVNPGTSGDFWSSAAFVSIHGGDRWGGEAVFEGDRAYYSPATMDGQWLYSLPRSEALIDWPLVIRVWDARAVAPNPDDDLASEYLKWKALPAAEQTPESLMQRLNAVRDARLDILYPRPPGQVSFNEMQIEWLKREIAKSKRYWLNFLFEFVLLSGCVWFALWPTIRSRSTRRNLAHLTLTPFLFLMPAWLGYCPVIINGVGPAGGIIYPWLLLPLRNMNFGFEWEYLLLKAYPQWFSTMNQSPAWNLQDLEGLKIGVPFPPGPLEAFIVGLCLCGGYAILRAIDIQYRDRRLRRPGFEVLPPTPSNTTPESSPPDPAPR